MRDWEAAAWAAGKGACAAVDAGVQHMLRELDSRSPRPATAPRQQTERLNAETGASNVGGQRRMRASLLNSWANINQRGHANLFHDHPSAERR